MSTDGSALVLLSHSPPEVCPGTRGAKVTFTVHVAPGASVRPVAQLVPMFQPGRVAGSVDTLVNSHGASPQFATDTFAVALLPTSSLPKRRLCWLAQKRPCAAAPHAIEKSASAMRKRFVCSISRREVYYAARRMPSPSSANTARTCSTAQSISSLVIPRGGANRTTVQWVSFDSTP